MRDPAMHSCQKAMDKKEGIDSIGWMPTRRRDLFGA